MNLSGKEKKKKKVARVFTALEVRRGEIQIQCKEIRFLNESYEL